MAIKRYKITEEIRSSLLNAAELNLLATSLIDITKKNNVADPFIIGAIELIEQDIDENNLAVKKERANEYTPLIQEKETERKNSFIGLKDAANAGSRRRNKDVQEAGKRINAIIEKAGSTIYMETYAVKLQGYTNLLDDLSTEEAKKDIDTLAIGDYVKELIEANEEFKTAYNNRRESSSKWEEISPSVARGNLFDDVNDFISSVNLLVSRFPGQYNALVNSFNDSINSVMKTARARKTRDNNSQDEENNVTEK